MHVCAVLHVLQELDNDMDIAAEEDKSEIWVVQSRK